MLDDEDALVPRDRLRGLLDAVALVGQELDLQVVLRQIATVAADLVDARYGALGVVAEDGTLAQFITVGLTPHQVADIGAPPHGKGLLGELITHPESLRLTDLGAHPATSGFPANHPPMTSFLGVPVRVHGKVFGNLYLTDKRSGEFDAEDEALVAGLASAVGITVENARLYDGARRRERRASATTEITTSLLSGAEPEAVLEIAAERAGDLVAADHGLVALRSGDVLLVEAGWGPGEPVARIDPSFFTESPRHLEESELYQLWPSSPPGTGVVVPLGSGLLVAARPAPGPRFSDDELSSLADFARQASVALELAERRRDAERLTVYADRDRIARDLHDLVIQRLFATGMTLEGIVRQIPDVVTQVKVRRAVDDLDQTIREIRSTIYELGHDPTVAVTTLRHRVLEAVDVARELLGFAPDVRLSGRIDTVVPDDLADQVVGVLREALSNAARHARARTVLVDVDVDRDIVVRVVDDGVGLPEGGRRSGLANLADRARDLGGAFSVSGRRGGGTELVWQAPVLTDSERDQRPRH